MSSHYASSHYGGSHYASSHYGRLLLVTPPPPPVEPLLPTAVGTAGSMFPAEDQASLRRQRRIQQEIRDDNELVLNVIKAFLKAMNR